MSRAVGEHVDSPLAGRVLTHAGQLVLRISHKAERLVELVAARTRLAAVRVRNTSG